MASFADELLGHFRWVGGGGRVTLVDDWVCSSTSSRAMCGSGSSRSAAS